MGLFADKITIVTGGASGIGRSLVEELARRGAIITLADINIKLAEEVADAVTKAGGSIKAVKLDVTDYNAVKAHVDSIVARKMRARDSQRSRKKQTHYIGHSIGEDLLYTLPHQPRDHASAWFKNHEIFTQGVSC